METDALTTSCSACLICGRGAGGRPAIRATPCCSAGFCTHCLKSAAAHAGKLFRCPSCRDEHGFLAHAKMLGVKVLDLTPAYADDDDLMVVVKACSAKRCLSPRGREFDATDIKPTRSVDLSAWRLVSCLSCGGSAVHAGCSATKLGLVWRCGPCGGDGDLLPPSKEREENFSEAVARLRSPSDALLDAVARREFPDLHQFGTGADASAHRAAALNYIETAMAKRPKRARAGPQ